MRFRTRSQEVEAVQWRGDNLEEVQALIPNVEREWEVESTLYVPSSSGETLAYLGSWIVKGATITGPDANGIDRYDDDVLTDDELTDTYEPVPDLIRTVADYEGLPDGTILEIVEVAGQWFELGCIIVKRDDLDEPFALEQRAVTFTASHLVAVGTVCSVVRLGGSQ